MSSPYERLCEGNIRFVRGESLTRNHIARRAELVSHQRPYAGLVTCSDSRISPEHVFDAGLGELFIVRKNKLFFSPILDKEWSITDFF